jgi:hypothetical protein
MRWFMEVDAVIASVKRVLSSGGFQQVEQDRLRKLVVQLEATKKGGKASRTEAVRLVAEISRVVCELCVRK